MSHVLLIGFMGAGKSTAGRLLAHETGLPFVDLDERIEAAAGTPIEAVFAQGEDVFRTLESGVLEALAAQEDSVVACGGGVVTRDGNIATLRRLGTVVYLKVSADQALARIGDTSTRPLLSGSGGVDAATMLLRGRESLYAAAADTVIDTDGLEPEDVVRRIAAVLSEAGR